jgi:hypothetical protein
VRGRGARAALRGAASLRADADDRRGRRPGRAPRGRGAPPAGPRRRGAPAGLLPPALRRARDGPSRRPAARGDRGRAAPAAHPLRPPPARLDGPHAGRGPRARGPGATLRVGARRAARGGGGGRRGRGHSPLERRRGEALRRVGRGDARRAAGAGDARGPARGAPRGHDSARGHGGAAGARPAHRGDGPARRRVRGAGGDADLAAHPRGRGALRGGAARHLRAPRPRGRAHRPARGGGAALRRPARRARPPRRAALLVVGDPLRRAAARGPRGLRVELGAGDPGLRPRGDAVPGLLGGRAAPRRPRPGARRGHVGRERPLRQRVPAPRRLGRLPLAARPRAGAARPRGAPQPGGGRELRHHQPQARRAPHRGAPGDAAGRRRALVGLPSRPRRHARGRHRPRAPGGGRAHRGAARLRLSGRPRDHLEHPRVVRPRGAPGDPEPARPPAGGLRLLLLLPARRRVALHPRGVGDARRPRGGSGTSSPRRASSASSWCPCRATAR